MIIKGNMSQKNKHKRQAQIIHKEISFGKKLNTVYQLSTTEPYVSATMEEYIKKILICTMKTKIDE